jgi:hypothetical protein
MDVKIEIDLKSSQATMDALAAIGAQAPFAVSKALNASANVAQQAVRDFLPSIMTLRQKSFIEKTIYRDRATDFATKDRLEAIVRTHPERNQLAKLVKGGVKTPEDGRVLAVPAEARRTKAGIIPRQLWIKNLQLRAWESNVLSSADAKRAFQRGAGQRTAAKGRKDDRAIVGAQKTWMTRDGIWQRVGKKVVLLYRFTKDVRIPASLPFEEIISAAAGKAWDEEMGKAIEYAIATAKSKS